MLRLIAAGRIFVLALVCILLSQQARSQYQFQRQIGYGIQGNSVQFKGPSGVTVDNQGTVYVTDIYHAKVWMFNKNSGQSLGSFGTLLSPDDDSMYQPTDVKVDNNGNIYVVDRAFWRVQKLSPARQLLFSITGLNSPNQMYIAADGKVYVCEYASSGRVFVYNPDGTEVTSWVAGDYLSGIVVDADNNVFVTEAFNAVVKKFDSTGALSMVIGAPGSGDGELNNPLALAIDNIGTIHVADAGNKRVQRFDANGHYLSQFQPQNLGPLEANFYPSGLAIDGDQNFYITDAGNSRLYKCTPGGAIIFKAGTSMEPAEFFAPRKVATNSSTFYVADGGYNRVQAFDLAGNYRYSIGSKGNGDGQFNNPSSIVADFANGVLVADANNRIQRFNAQGIYVLTFGSSGSDAGQFQTIADMALTSSGLLYVADQYNHRIQAFNINGVYLFSFGSQGTGNGQFNYPQSIAVDRFGNVYVGDNNQGRVQKFTPQGVYSNTISPSTYEEGQFSNPGALAVDGQGYLNVGDWNLDQVLRFTPEGALAERIGSRGSKPGEFYNIQGLALMQDNTLIAVDGNNDRVQLFKYSAPPTILAVQPATTWPGEKVIIVGQNFDGHFDANIVSFNGIAVQVVGGNANSLNVIVPEGVTTGPITITANGKQAIGNVIFTAKPPIAISSFSPNSTVVFDPAAINSYLFVNYKAPVGTALTSGEFVLRDANGNQLTNELSFFSMGNTADSGYIQLKFNYPYTEGGQYKVTSPATLKTSSPMINVANFDILEIGRMMPAAFNPPFQQVQGFLQYTGPYDGCTAWGPNSFAGKIAVIDRGTCSFPVKVKNAQNAGALGVIVVNNVQGQGAVAMGGVDPTITISSYMVSYTDGQSLKAMIASGRPPLTAFKMGTKVLEGVTLAHNFTIRTKENQSIFFPPIGELENNGRIFKINCTGGGSGLPVTFQSSNPGIIAIVGDSAKVVGAGTAIITASQAGNEFFKPATPVQRPIVVYEGPKMDIVFGRTGEVIQNLYPGAAVVDVGSVEVGSSLSNSFFIRNIGGAPVSINAVSTSSGSPFAIDYPGISSIPVGSDLAFEMIFTPEDVGPANEITVTFDTNLPGQFFSFRLTGTGTGLAAPTVPASNIAISPLGNSLVVSFQPGNGNKRAVLVKTVVPAAPQSGEPAAPAPAGGTAPAAPAHPADAGGTAPAAEQPHPAVECPACLRIPRNTVLTANTDLLQPPAFQMYRVVAAGEENTVNVTGLIPGTTYTFYVVEYNQEGNNTAYLGAYVPQNEYQVPTIQSPTVASSNVTFTNVLSTSTNVSFIAGNGQSHLVVMKAGSVPAFSPTDDMTFSGDLDNGESVVYSGSGTSFALSNLLPATTYFLKIFEFNSSTSLTRYLSSSTASGSQKTLALPVVYVSSPSNGVVNQSIKLNVTSTTWTGALTYTIELSKSADFTTGVRSKTGGRTLAFDSLSYGTLYYTRVKTSSRADYGKVTTFTTAPAEYYSYVTSPANNSINNTFSLNVTSNTVSLATTYTIELNPDPAFGAATAIVKSGARTLNFPVLAPATTYYTRVKTDQSTGWGQTRSFTTKSAESISYVTSPVNGTANLNTTVNVSANTIPGSTSYTIQLSEFADFSAVAFEITGLTRTLTFANLKYNTTYYNRVKTDVGATYGEVRSFSTRKASSISYVTSPADNAININAVVSLSSNTVPGASLYTIQLSKTIDFANVDFEVSGPSRTLSFTGLAYNTKYYNRVRTDLDAQFGVVKSFTTRTAESITYVTSPADNSVNAAISLNISSNTVPGATTYTIQLSTTPDFATIDFEKSGARTLAFTGLMYNTVYYNRVKTDLSPAFGQVKSFQTKDAATLAYLSNPADGALNVNYVTNVVSKTVHGATQYTIELNTSPDFTGESLTKFSAIPTIGFQLGYNTKYFVRVKTDMSTNWGPTKSFTVGDPVSLAFVTSPKSGGVGAPTTVNISANLVTGASSYTIELNTSADFTGTSLVKSSASRTIRFISLLEGTVYYNRVKTNLDPAWGPPQMFTTINPIAGGRSLSDWEGEDAAEVSMESMKVDVYPNPFRERLSLRVETPARQPLQIRLMDLTGKEMHRSEHFTNGQVDIETNFAAGVYLLQLNSGGELKVVKVMKME